MKKQSCCQHDPQYQWRRRNNIRMVLVAFRKLLLSRVLPVFDDAGSGTSCGLRPRGLRSPCVGKIICESHHPHDFVNIVSLFFRIMAFIIRDIRSLRFLSTQNNPVLSIFESQPFFVLEIRLVQENQFFSFAGGYSTPQTCGSMKSRSFRTVVGDGNGDHDFSSQAIVEFPERREESRSLEQAQEFRSKIGKRGKSASFSV